MSELFHISRSFTELGAFNATEILDFYTRRILTPTDFIRQDGADVWLSLNDWLAGASPDTATSATQTMSRPKAAQVPQTTDNKKEKATGTKARAGAGAKSKAKGAR